MAKAQAAKQAEAIAPRPFDVQNSDDLTALAESGRAAAKEVAEKVDPTNVFALRFTALADAADELKALFIERGHTGVPQEATGGE